MSTDISTFGTKLYFVASNTFPVGFPVDQFADDAEPFDFPSVQIADAAMGLNGDLFHWAKANKLDFSISLVPNTPDDTAMQILAKANRVGKGKSVAKDVITMTVIYPDNSTVTFIGGIMTDSQFGKSSATSGRMKTRTYKFTFESMIGL